MDNRKTTAKTSGDAVRGASLQPRKTVRLHCLLPEAAGHAPQVAGGPDNSNVLLGAGPGKYCKIHQFSHLGRKTVGKYLNCCSLSLFALDTVASCRKLPAFCRMNRREEH